MNKSHNYTRILIIRLDRIGDVLLSTPVIKAVRQAYPDSHIAFMVRPYARDIVEGNPYLNEVIVYDKTDSLKFINILRREKFDITIILHPTSRTHIVTFLAGIPVRIGYDKKWGFLLTKKIPHAKQFGARHEIDYTLDLLRSLDIEPADKALYMPVKEESEKKIKDLFGKADIKDSDLIVAANPGASCPSKRWSPANFAKVADRLIQKYNAKVVVISDSNDKIFADSMVFSMKSKALNLAGQTSVADLASILRRSRLFVSNDSGPVHIACAVGTPVVAIFGRSDRGLSPLRWGPSGERDVVLHKDVGCAKCLAHNCKIGFKCLEAITPDDVLQAAEKILRG